MKVVELAAGLNTVGDAVVIRCLIVLLGGEARVHPSTTMLEKGISLALHLKSIYHQLVHQAVLSELA